MSVSNIPEKVKFRLWGKAAGRCEYEGCNQRLWLDSLTKEEFNAAYIAHIVADSPAGPRGDPILSARLATEISNLMLMCDVHHRLIDKEDVAGHTVERLQAMKDSHETRIDILTDISKDRQSHILIYGANIGKQESPLSFKESSLAMVPAYYPASTHPLTLSLKNSSFEDSTPEYWQVEGQQLRNMIMQQVRPRIKSGEIAHLSVFALAPQPLLMLLGSLLSDIPAVEVYQLRKEPKSWKWENAPTTFEYTIISPDTSCEGDPCLVFALSATVNDERIFSIMGTKIPIWKVTIPEPHNDFVRSKAQTMEFRIMMRKLLNTIKATHGEKGPIHVFPAMPVSLAVDLGRVHNTKSDLPLIIYDENKGKGGFIQTLEINGKG